MVADGHHSHDMSDRAAHSELSPSGCRQSETRQATVCARFRNHLPLNLAIFLNVVWPSIPLFASSRRIKWSLNWNRNWKSISAIKRLSLQTLRYCHYPFNIAYQIMWSISLSFSLLLQQDRAEAQFSNYLLSSLSLPYDRTAEVSDILTGPWII